MAAEADRRWMRRALAHARQGLGRTTPNPVVGACVVTDEGVVVGDGVHERAGAPHAEIHALEAAGAAARGATLYCTLEPCAHTGRTAPCTERIVAAGIRRVVAAVEDPFPQVAGRGFAILRAHGIEVDVGVEREAAIRLNQPFFTVVRLQRPFVVLKVAASLDGRIGRRGERIRLTSIEATRHAHGVRAWVDAIAVGSGTILSDDPLLTVREVYRERPLTRVVLDRRLRTPPGARLFSTRSQGPILILTSERTAAACPDRVRALGEAGAEVVALDRADLAAALRALPSREIQSLVLEGGTCVHTAAWDAGLVDYVQAYIAPVSLGADAVPMLSARGFSLAALVDRRVERLGPDVLIEGYVHRPH